MLTNVNVWIAIVLGILLLSAFFLLYTNRSSDRRLMSKLAREFGCEQDQYRFRNRFYVRFVRQGVPFFVSTFQLRAKQNLRVVSVWREPSFRMRLYANRLPVDEREFLSLEDVDLGDTKFDHDYIVNAHNANRVRQLLTDLVRDTIRELGLEISLDISGNRIQLDYWISDSNVKLEPTDATRVIKQFMLIYFEMDRSSYKDSGLVLTADELTMNLIENANSICMVCGEPIEGGQAVVNCGACDSRHHFECWQYIGSCSTYGCGGKQASS